jgi:hypothetical protein
MLLINYFLRPKTLQIWDGIKVGSLVTGNGKYPGHKDYFRNGPLKVHRMGKGPKFAGSKIVYCCHKGFEIGFYINGLKLHV